MSQAKRTKRITLFPVSKDPVVYDDICDLEADVSRNRIKFKQVLDLDEGGKYQREFITDLPYVYEEAFEHSGTFSI